MRDKFGKDETLKKLSETIAILDEEAVKVGGQARKRHLYSRALNSKGSPRNSTVLNASSGDPNGRASSSSISGSRPPATLNSNSGRGSHANPATLSSTSSATLSASKAPASGTDHCASCGKELDPSESSVLSMGRRWHEACFKCSECGNAIRGPFVNNNGVPRCLTCQPKMKVCAKCGKDIHGNFLHIASKAYHQECFTCHLCSKVMGTAEIFGYVDPNEPDVSFAICPDCNAKVNK